MNEQPSKSSRANHSPKTSKIPSSRCAGVALLLVPAVMLLVGACLSAAVLAG